MSTSMSRNSSSDHTKIKKIISREESGAIFSPDRMHRYLLWRSWSGVDRMVLFVALNPSTADERVDDPTIRRCSSFAQEWGATGFMVANLFAFRATKPKDLMLASDPIGMENDRWLRGASSYSTRTIVCWGNDGAYGGRSANVLPLLKQPEALRVNKGGQPSHPLYLPGFLRPIPYSRAEQKGHL